MAMYLYKAMARDGRIHRGRMTANNPADLEAHLDRLGLDLLVYRNSGARGRLYRGKGLTRRDLMIFCFHLEQGSRAGVPVIESLSDLHDGADERRIREIISFLIAAIEGGRTLSEAMRDHPRVFDTVFCNLVSAGEQSGRITEVFSRIGENLKWEDEQAVRARKLLIYPAMVCGMIMCVIFFLMIYLVPELVRFIRTMGQELPLHTRALIAVSDVFVEYWYMALIFPVLLTGAVWVCIRTSTAVRYRVDLLILHLPVIGPILKKIILTRLIRFFAIMYASGITIIECIRSAEQIAGNLAVESAMRMIGQSISDGETLTAGFAQAGLFPPLVLRMIGAGERTGTLENSLHGICYFYTRDIKDSIDRLQTMVEPAITVTLGMIIGWVVFSVLGPIYDLITQIKI